MRQYMTNRPGRRRALTSRSVAALAAAALLWIASAAEAEAQRRPSHTEANRWSFSPYAGVFSDPFDVSPDGEDMGWMLGFRVGYDVGRRTRLIGNVGYAESDDVTSGPVTVDRSVFDNQYILTTAGGEYDILPGNTSVSLGVEAGGAWRQVAFDHRLGGDGPTDSGGDGYTFYFTVAPSLAVRHRFTARTALELSLRDYIFPEDRVEHAPALSIGFRFR